ncbi:MAG: putative holin-like toxin [Lachnospiraceae bacterium]
MDTYQVLSLIFFAGNFLLALLTYIDRNNKRK